MAPARIDAGALASLLPRDANVYVQGCSAESLIFADALEAAGETLGAMSATGIFVPGLNRRTWRPNNASRTCTFFVTPELAKGAVDFKPWCYADVLAYLRGVHFDAAIFSVSPPDEHGICSFGSTVDFLPLLWRSIPIRITHINPCMPRTYGFAGIPFSDITAFIDTPAPLLEQAPEAADSLSAAIATHVAAHIEDGATLQTGLGKTPAAVLNALRDRKKLRLHSGLIGDAVVDLRDAGALDDEIPILAGVAIGSRRLYDAIADRAFSFQPVTITHGLASLSAIKGFVAINSALQVDLFGQAHAEMTPRGFMSGPGGASDFARGARAGGGLRIVALPATARDASRIVAPGAGRGPVSLGRMDTDIVVTEFGAADLRTADHETRARSLIGVAHPDHREQLSRAWASYTTH
jgi:acyl-CoA hydrolase